jgi:anti-sigma B factor antagonist
MSTFKIEERKVGDITVLDMAGQMRIGESGVVFCQTIRRLVEVGRRKILLNLQGITHIDSTGLGELIASYNTLDKKGGRVKLLHLAQRVRELMIITKLVTVFDVYESESEALHSFQSFALDQENSTPTAVPLGASPVHAVPQRLSRREQ